MRIFYIGNYSHSENFRNLKTIPSGVAKMNYILSALKRAGFNITIFSSAPSACKRFQVFYSEKINIEDKADIYYPLVLGEANLLLIIIARLYIYIQMLWFVIFKVKRDDCLLIYHIWQYRSFVRLIRSVKKCRFFFEVEEIYNAAWQNEQKKIDKEIKYLQGADGYILVNDLIKDKCGFKTDNYCVCYGDYNVHVLKKNRASKDYIHLVYAGVIGVEGSDVDLAIDIMHLLPDNYKLFILGYGVDTDIERMKMKILDTNIKLGEDRIIYKGCLFGEEYSSFLTQCDIGLCTRVLQDSLSDFTFPSKVLVYLGHSLIPVCSPISCIQKSKVASSIVFCENITPQAVVEAILSIKFRNIDSHLLTDLDSEFVNRLSTLFGKE